jgi:hypothetical protein
MFKKKVKWNYKKIGLYFKIPQPRAGRAPA